MSETNRFNLIDEPWIPVLGKNELVSLKQVFTDQGCLELSGSPLQKIALTKLLLAIAQAAHTPKDDAEWRTMGANGLAKYCIDYLLKWHDAFWLYGERPFLQMPAIKKAETKRFGIVSPDMALSDNTTILAQHQIERSFLDADKALLLVSLMGCALGGKKTDATVSLSPGYEKKKTGKPGAFVGSRGYLHTFLSGRNLQETLWFNLFSAEQIEKMEYRGLGTAVWEKMPNGECCSIAEDLKDSFMGKLVPVSRFCLLSQEGVHYSEGLSHPTFETGIGNPSLIIDRSRKKARVIWVDPEKRPWRLLTSLLGFTAQNQGQLDCVQIRQGLDRVRTVREVFGIWSGGLKVSNKAGEQYASGEDDFVESKIVLQSDLMDKSWFERLRSEMNLLEDFSIILRKSINYYYLVKKAENPKQSKKHSNTSINLFWQLCEQKFQALINACANQEESDRRALRKEFIEIVHQVFDHSCPMETARQLDAWASAKRQLDKAIRTHKHLQDIHGQ